MRLIDGERLISGLADWQLTVKDQSLRDAIDECIEAIAEQPTITLKEHAKAEGYSLIKREPMPKLKPCPLCGASGRKIEEWVCRTGYFYICSECNHQSNPARSERKARENWNETDSH